MRDYNKIKLKKIFEEAKERYRETVNDAVPVSFAFSYEYE